MPKKLAPFFLFILTFVLIILFSFPGISAQEESKPKAKDWQINGIAAALDDPYPGVQSEAFRKLSEYDWQGEPSEQLRDFAKKAADILKDEQIDLEVRRSAAGALGNLGEVAQLYAQDLAGILKNEKADSYLRSNAAIVLGNLGEVAQPYVQDILDLLKDKQIASNFSNSAALALGNLGEVVQPYVRDIVEILKDEQIDSDVRSNAAQALGNLGELATPYVQDILNILKDEQVDSNVRRSTAQALGNLGELAAPYAKDIAGILKNEKADSDILGSVAIALGNLGEAAAPYVQDILDFLQDEQIYFYAHSSAAIALGNLGELAQPYVKDIADILKDERVDSNIRSGAAVALGNLGEVAAPYIKDLVDILKDEQIDLDIRDGAAQALENLGEVAAPYVQDLVDILKDEQIHSFVRGGAANVLVNLGDVAQPYVKDILDFLKDEQIDSNIRNNSARVLGNLGDAAVYYVPNILDFLKDEQVDSLIRSNVAEIFRNLGEAASLYAEDILDFLKDEQIDSDIRSSTAKALGKIIGKKLELDDLVAVLNNIYYSYYNYGFAQWRFQAYFLGGGTEEVKTLLIWLGNRDSKGIPDKLSHEEGKKALQLFNKTWKYSEGLKLLRRDLAEKIAYVAKKTPWQAQDMMLLQRHYNNLKAANSDYALTVKSELNNLQYWKWFFRARNIIALHIAFWLALIFAYPKSPQIQAIFFWNPWIRKIAGVGYVDFFLTWIPFLRRKLFEPFQPSLLADARLNEFAARAYFPNSLVKKNQQLKPINQAIPTIKGQIVLEGDSGLGKSMFLRHLLHKSKRIVVYLPARKCNKGVIAAIQAKLHGQAKDPAFLKNLIYLSSVRRPSLLVRDESRTIIFGFLRNVCAENCSTILRR